METAQMSPFTPVLLLWLFLMLAAVSAFPVWFAVSLRRHIREKTRPRVVSFVCLGLGLVTLLCYVALLLLRKNGISLCLCGLVSEEWTRILEPLFPLLIGLGCLLFAPRKLASVSTVGGCVLLVLVLMAFRFLITPFGDPELHKTTLTAPDTLSEPHEILVVEHDGFLSNRSVVYERVSPHVLRRLGEYYPHDGWLLVYEGSYTVDWREDGFTLSCHMQSESFDFFDS